MTSKQASTCILVLLVCLAARPPAPAAAPPAPAPVYPSGITAEEANVMAPTLAQYLAMSDAQLRALVPNQTGISHCGCPNCQGGSAENDLVWSPDDGDHVRCRSCGKVYPSADYPMTKEVRVTSPRGGEHVYRYYEDAEGTQYFFKARVWYDRIHYYDEVALQLAQVYAVTKDERYARSAAALVDQYACVVPGYVPKYEYPHRPKQFFGAEIKPPYPITAYRVSRYYNWAYGDIPDRLLLAYDLIRASPALDDAMRARIESDLIRGSVDWVLLNPERLTNMSPVVWRGMIRAGRIIGEPDYVHDAVGRAGRLLQEHFFYDHFWREGTPSYHNQTIEWLKTALDAAAGYTDPAGYLSPRDGRRFDNLNPDLLFPDLPRAREAVANTRLPDGRYAPIKDTWWTDRAEPLERSESQLLPAMGYAILGSGTGENQVQLHLSFSGGHGHAHRDSLSLLFWARGSEQFSDLGYTATKLVPWTLCSASHNTLLIDQRDQETGTSTDGNLLLWCDRGLSPAVEADGRPAYPQAAVYRRLLALVQRPGALPFAIDVFRVAGGEIHDWFLHGNADADTDVRLDLSMRPFAGTLTPPEAPFLPPVNFRDFRMLEHTASPGFYGFLRDVSHAATNGPWRADFASPDGRATRLIMVGSPGTEVFSGRDPSVRRAGRDDSLIDRYTRPFVIARRRPAGEQSVFAAILDPAADQPDVAVSEVTPLLVDDQAAILRIVTPSATYLVATCTDPTRLITCRSPEGTVVFRGRFGVMRRDGRSLSADSVGASRLRWGSRGLSGGGRLEVRVLAVSANALEVEMRSDDLERLASLTIIVTHGDGTTHGYRIVRAVRVSRRRVRLSVERTGFIYDAKERVARFTTYPLREIPGETRYSIDLVCEDTCSLR